MDGSGDSSLCFLNHNSSCRRLLLPLSKTALFHKLLTLVSLLTVMLNLLVIISISHFRQLRTPTNSLLQSLAVSDLVVGLLVMPVEGLRYLETCWLLGRLMCALTPSVFYCLISTSLGHTVLISVDHYVAICDPLLYPTRISVVKVQICVSLCWACSMLYKGLIMMDHLGWPDRFSSCHGESVVVIGHISGIVDLFVSFIAPCTVMVVFYLRVLLAALSAACHPITDEIGAGCVRIRVDGSQDPRRCDCCVYGVFLSLFLPFLSSGEDMSNSFSYYAMLSWIMMLNSSMNPLIYALFYHWFRKASNYNDSRPLTRQFECVHLHFKNKNLQNIQSGLIKNNCKF